MNTKKNSLLSFLLIFFAAFSAAAQAPAPTPASLADLAEGEGLSSAEDNFYIRLHKDLVDNKIVPDGAMGDGVTGTQHMWRYSGTIFQITVANFPAKLINNEADYEKLIAQGKAMGLAATKGEFVSQAKINLGQYKGYEILFTLANGGRFLSRAFAVEKKLYNVVAIYPPDSPEIETLAKRTLDSFKLLEPLSEDQIFVSTEGNFSIRLRRELAVNLPTPADPTNHAYFWDYSTIHYMVLFMEPKGPETAVDKFYEQFFNNQKKHETDQGGKFVSQTRIKVAGYDGVELRMLKAGGDMTIVRGVKIGKKYYQFGAMLKPGDKDGEIQVIRALDSFKLAAAKH
jgi:hypothetical protein